MLQVRQAVLILVPIIFSIRMIEHDFYESAPVSTGWNEESERYVLYVG